ncbi:Two pore potassium channel protein sup-9 [Harpegnathos saltator]|uniref:Two pore potassium channel protein sup-9 n=1 Tax=Harpegnathos saltator TaxID=610380 RepID=E2C7D1_HARSA|nr:Two pore potassium channel protein sup-9 [Harpegnathos saltator]
MRVSVRLLPEKEDARYGHIAPKTKNGKVVTIFYAILGIPLMLLCLSNIGDVMASSFRFLYWKVCCYICTKPPKKRRSRNTFVRSYSVRQPGRYGSSKGAFRRSIRVSQRSADSALGLSESMTKSSYSDTDCRYMPRRFEGSELRAPGADALPTNHPTEERAATMPRYSTDVPLATPRSVRASPRMTTQSLDRKLLMGPSETDRSQVLCNRYALDDLEDEMLRWQQPQPPPPPRNRGEYRPHSAKCWKKLNKTDVITVGNSEKPQSNGTTDEPDNAEKQTSLSPRPLPRRCLSVEGTTTNSQRTGLASGLRPAPVYLEMEHMGRSQSTKSRRTRSNYSVARSYKRGPSPRIMSPMGFAVLRQVYADDIDFDNEYYAAADDQEKQPTKPVPIWLCVFLVVSYIFGGAYLFSEWEKWPFLDSAYFCFITLTTIGFGDFVPAYKLDAHKGIALCSLYLLFGIALLAMSFNLVQEEVINNVKSVAKRLGIIKETDDEEEAEDYDEYDAEYEEEVYENEPEL